MRAGRWAPTSLINVLVILVAVKRRHKVLRELASREEDWRRKPYTVQRLLGVLGRAAQPPPRLPVSAHT